MLNYQRDPEGISNVSELLRDFRILTATHPENRSFKCTRLLPLFEHRTKRQDLNSESGTCGQRGKAPNSDLVV